MAIVDEVRDARYNSAEFDGLYDEAYTIMIEDIKKAASLGRRDYRWLEYQYPSLTGTVNAELLATWLLKDGFRVAYLADSEPRIWVVKWEDKDAEQNDRTDN